MESLLALREHYNLRTIPTPSKAFYCILSYLDYSKLDIFFIKYSVYAIESIIVIKKFVVAIPVCSRVVYLKVCHRRLISY